METKALIEKMASMAASLPRQAAVVELQQFNQDELHNRARRFLGMSGDACQRSFERGDWVVKENRTLVRLTEGAKAVIYHASGAMELQTGLEPMANLFERMEERDVLTGMLEKAAAGLDLKSWLGPNEAVKFEHLFQIKAAGGDRQGNLSKPVLCRAVGAFRHFVADLPVLGEASVVVKLAGGGALDSLAFQFRPTTDRVIEKVRLIRPEVAARQVLEKMSGLMSGSKVEFSEVVEPLWLQFGYFSLGKRKAQRLLAPAYVAALHTTGDEEMNYLTVVSASEKQFMSFEGCISEAPALSARKR